MTQREVWEGLWKEKTCGLNIKQIIDKDPYYRLTLRLFPELNKLNKKEIYMAEIGCGSGIRSLAIRNYFKNVNLHIFLIDFSLSSIRYAVQNAKVNKVKAEFIIADALNLPFRDCVFDIVYNEGVNEHFDGIERFRIFEEMSRVVRLGGYMIVIVPNAMNLCYRIAKKILEIQGRWRYGLEKPYTLWELKSKFRKFNVMPLKVGGISVITSISWLLQIKTPQICRSDVSSSKRYLWKTNVRLKDLFESLDILLEKLLGFLFGSDIGICGLKVLSRRKLLSRKLNLENVYNKGS